MSRNDNYPDDIRSFDHVPGSPFYEDPDAWVDTAATDLSEQWITEFKKDGIISYNGYEAADIAVLMEESQNLDMEDVIYNLAYDTVLTYPEDYRPEPMPQEDWE